MATSPTPTTESPPPPSAAPPAAVARRQLMAGVGGVLRRSTLLLLLAGSLLFFSVWGKTTAVFLSADNFRNILGSQSVLAVLTLGAMMPLVAGQFDLSVGNVAGLSSVLSAGALAHWHFPLWAGLGVGVGVGALVGVVNGLLVTRLGVNALITTLGTASVISGFVSWYTGGLSIIQGVPDSLTSFGGGSWLAVPRTTFVLALVAALVYYLLEHTPYGRNLHAVGSNSSAAHLVGIRVRTVVFGSFVASGALAGIAGVLLLAYSGAGNPQIGATFTLTTIASAFLGAAVFRPGRLNVPGSLVAIFFIAVNLTGLTYAGVRDYINDLFVGTALVLAVAMSTLLSRRAASRASRPPAGTTPTAGGDAGAQAAER